MTPAKPIILIVFSWMTATLNGGQRYEQKDEDELGNIIDVMGYDVSDIKKED